VSPQEWEATPKELLARENKLTRARDSRAVVGDLLDGPAVAVRVGEGHESTPREVVDLGDLQPSPRELVPGCLDVVDDELKPL
jgi:hypothetical protein